jgi:hypothetical protein
VTDERAAGSGRRPGAHDDEPLDAEQAEALSRAAREAVRQPADPRIERSFAHLGLVPEADAAAQPAPAARSRSRRAPASAVDRPAREAAASPEAPHAAPGTLDAEPLLDAIAAWQRSTDELRRRLDILTWLLAGVTALIGVLALVLILRGPG